LVGIVVLFSAYLGYPFSITIGLLTREEHDRMSLSSWLFIFGICLFGGGAFAAAFIAAMIPVDGDLLPAGLRLLRRFSAINSKGVGIAVPVFRHNSGNVLRWRVSSVGLSIGSQFAVLRTILDTKLMSSTDAPIILAGVLAELSIMTLWCTYIIFTYRRVSRMRRSV
jgi:hypothetical protein